MRVCDFPFEGFTWVDLATVLDRDLAKKPEVFVLRLIVEKNEDPLVLRGKVLEAYSAGIEILRKAKWKRLTKYWGPRFERLKRIDPSTCPVIYIGGTGKGTGTIRSRFADLAGWRHTIFPCILALRLVGWNIQFGYKTVSKGEEAFKTEKELIRKYTKIHGKLPALNAR